MSKISTIHDALITLVAAELPSYQQLANPYIFEENNELFLSKGFGVAVSAGARTDRLVSCRLSWQRDFTIILTNQVTATDHDITGRETVTKALLEDHFSLLEAIEKDVTLDGSAIKSEVISDSGIQFLEVDTARYFLIELDVTTEYLENI